MQNKLIQNESIKSNLIHRIQEQNELLNIS